MTKLFAMEWTEYEAGWGSRPDGFTIYKTKEAAKKHILEAEQNKKYECFSVHSLDSLLVINMNTPIDFGDNDFVWETNANFLGYKTNVDKNGKKHKDKNGDIIIFNKPPILKYDIINKIPLAKLMKG